MKYPKLSAAIDELLAKMVREQGEEALGMAIAWATAVKDAKSAPVEEKLPPIPVTKEEVVDAD